jgi:hypothetical protein
MDFSRTYLADGPFVPAKQNQVKACLAKTIRTDNAQKLKIGPWSSRGRNILDLLDGDKKFVTQNDLDTSTGHILDARDNFWRIAGAGDFAEADTVEIRNRIDTETTDTNAYKRVDIQSPDVMAESYHH